MGDTNYYDLPYPASTGKVSLGYKNIQDLAEQIDSILYNAGLPIVGSNITTLRTDTTFDGILAGTYNTLTLNNDAVTTAKILNDAVTTAKILDANVTGAKIEDSVALAGSPTTTTQAQLDDSTKIATTEYVDLAAYNIVIGTLPPNSIVNSMVNASAAISYSKLNLTGSVLEADLAFSIATQAELDAVASTAATNLSNHEADTTSVHGIADTSVLATDSEVASAQSAAESYADSAVSTHSSDTTSIHGITDTADLVLTGDARLSDARTPTSHAATHIPGGSDAIDLTKITAIAATLPTLPDALYPAGALIGIGTVAPYLLYRSAGSTWDQIGGAGGGSIEISDTAPSTPDEGNLWFDSTTGKTFIWYVDGSSDQWVEVGEASQLAIPSHGSSHVRGGSDIIDGDRLTVDYVPSYYTRNAAASGAGDVTDLAASLAGIDDKLNILLNTPSCKANKNVTQTLSSGGSNTLIWSGADIWDTHSMHDPTTNNTRIYVPSNWDGLYLITWNYNLTAYPVTQTMATWAMINGAGRYGYTEVGSTQNGTLGFTSSTVVNLTAGQYVEISAYMTSTGYVVAANNNEFVLTYLRKTP